MQTDPIRVLLVEDNPGDARLVELSLSEVTGTHFEVVHADRLGHALTVLRSESFDAVLLDLSLPDSFGLDTASQIEAADPSLPIVVLSGLADDAVALEAVKGGAQDYLVKGQGGGDLVARSIRYAMERKRIEEALRRSEKMLEEAQRIAHVGHWSWIIATGEVSWSDEVFRMLGYQPREFTPTYELFLATVARGDRQSLVDRIDAALHGEIAYSIEHRIVRTDGGERVVENRGEVEQDVHGRPLRVHGTLQDITAYKTAEAALRKARDELEARVEERTAHLAEVNRQLEHEIVQRRRTEEILRGERDFSSAVLDTVGALVVVLDGEGRIIRFNRACEQTTGFAFAEVRGKRVWEVFAAPEEVQVIKHVLEELRRQRVPNKHESYWLTRKGERRLIAWSNTVLSTRNGAAEHVIATGIDITDQRKAEEHERQRMLELAHVSRLSTMGEMTTELAHELNQPLAAIATYSDAALRLMRVPAWEADEVEEVLEEISGQAQRAGEVIRRLRSFARKEDSKRVHVDVNELVRDMVYLTEAEARWHEVGLFLELDDSLPEVLADRILIEQVIINLVRNAIDVLSSQQCRERRVTIQTAPGSDGAVTVEVTDTGPGLTPDGIKKVFEPFFTTKATGMGMGLAISQSIIEAHGGRLWVTSEQGKGATFGFHLPIAVVEEELDAV
ncbi:MAG: PAS domain S-box protein [Gammaproteobacteria bacterium]